MTQKTLLIALLLLPTAMRASAQSVDELKAAYSGKFTWDETSATLRFTASGNVNFSDTGACWPWSGRVGPLNISTPLAFAYSPAGKLAGPWQHDVWPVLWDDRSHGMVFRDFDGRLLLCLHRYFHQPKTRVQLWELEGAGNRLQLGKQILGAP